MSDVLVIIINGQNFGENILSVNVSLLPESFKFRKIRSPVVTLD